jgi:hypothetical protein
LADFSDSMTRNSSAGVRQSGKAENFHRVEGPADLIGLPWSSTSDFTLPP